MEREKTLPPDPDQMNDHRAELAEASLRHFQCWSGADHKDALADLLCNLMHWCDRNEFRFEEALGRGRMQYLIETGLFPEMN